MMRLVLILALILQVSICSLSGDHASEISSPHQDWMLEAQNTEGATPHFPRAHNLDFSPAFIFAQYLISFPTIELTPTCVTPFLPRSPFLLTQPPHSSQGPPSLNV